MKREAKEERNTNRHQHNAERSWKKTKKAHTSNEKWICRKLRWENVRIADRVRDKILIQEVFMLQNRPTQSDPPFVSARWKNLKSKWVYTWFFHFVSFLGTSGSIYICICFAYSLWRFVYGSFLDGLINANMRSKKHLFNSSEFVAGVREERNEENIWENYQSERLCRSRGERRCWVYVNCLWISVLEK